MTKENIYKLPIISSDELNRLLYGLLKLYPKTKILVLFSKKMYKIYDKTLIENKRLVSSNDRGLVSDFNVIVTVNIKIKSPNKVIYEIDSLNGTDDVWKNNKLKPILNCSKIPEYYKTHPYHLINELIYEK